MIDVDALRNKSRRTAILHILYQVWPRPLGAGMIAESLTPDVCGDADEVRRALHYLRERCLAEPTGHVSAGATAIYRLTAAGVDAVESDPSADLARTRWHRMLRLRVLQALDWGGLRPMPVALISTALAEDTDLDLSEPSVRRALAYLVERELAADCAADGHPDMWRILPDGTDYLAGDGDGIEGVARPQVW
jgi:hypothetical protein